METMIKSRLRLPCISTILILELNLGKILELRNTTTDKYHNDNRLTRSDHGIKDQGRPKNVATKGS